jgi:hypothetical protein
MTPVADIPLKPGAAIAADLLGEIAELAIMVLRPAGDVQLRITRCAALSEQLEREIAGAQIGVSRFLNNFAPLLLAAIGNALRHRARFDDPAAATWESLVGFLIPHVRADAWAALSWLRDISREGSAS